MHDRLVRLVLEVAIPATLEMWSRPLLHLLELLLRRPDLNASLDAIGGQWSSAFEVPLIEDSFLDFWNTADEVIEALGV